MKTKIIMVIAISILLASCSKENYTLTGSIWETKVESDVMQTLEFERSRCIMHIKVFGKTIDTSPYDYVLNYPTVILYAIEESKADLEGTINGTTMTVRNTSKNVYLNPFYRK